MRRAKFNLARASYSRPSLNLKFQTRGEILRQDGKASRVGDLYGATAPFRRYQHLTFFALLSCIARKNSALLSGISSG